MRIPLPTDFKTRTGAPDKDPRQKNSCVEVKGDQATVRKRPSAQGGIAVGAGIAQGGIGFTIAGTPYLIGFWGDTMQTYTGGGTSWNAGTLYMTGSHVSFGFIDYWATSPNTNSSPPVYDPKNPQSKYSNPNWSPIFTPITTGQVWMSQNIGNNITAYGDTAIAASTAFLGVWPYFGCGNYLPGGNELYTLNGTAGAGGCSAEVWTTKPGGIHVPCPGVFSGVSAMSVTTRIL